MLLFEQLYAVLRRSMPYKSKNRWLLLIKFNRNINLANFKKNHLCRLHVSHLRKKIFGSQWHTLAYYSKLWGTTAHFGALRCIKVHCYGTLRCTTMAHYNGILRHPYYGVLRHTMAYYSNFDSKNNKVSKKLSRFGINILTYKRDGPNRILKNL